MTQALTLFGSQGAVPVPPSLSMYLMKRRRIEATTVSGVAGHVEVSKPDDRYRSGRTVDVRERAVRRDVRVQDPRVARRETVVSAAVDEVRPIFVVLVTETAC